MVMVEWAKCIGERYKKWATFRRFSAFWWRNYRSNQGKTKIRCCTFENPPHLNYVSFIYFLSFNFTPYSNLLINFFYVITFWFSSFMLNFLYLLDFSMCSYCFRINIYQTLLPLLRPSISHIPFTRWNKEISNLPLREIRIKLQWWHWEQGDEPKKEGQNK